MRFWNYARTVVRIFFVLAVVAGIGLIAETASARTDCNVQVDCSTHEITVLGKTTRIDCGRSGHPTYNGVGRIGGYHHGRIVHNGIEIVGIPRMGADGGGKVFHSVSWGPRGINQSNGCIHVIPKVRDQLHRCQGSRLEIAGANSQMRAPRGYKPRHHRHRRFRYENDEGPGYFEGQHDSESYQ